MEKISITRALAQLKLLDSRIKKEIANTRFVGIYQARDRIVKGTNLNREEFEKKAISEKQSIDDLIKRRMVIKSAILISNANTSVVIGGEKYLVVEAIERKNSIEYDKHLLASMRSQYTENVNIIETNNTKINNQIDDMVKANLGADKQVSKNDYDNVSKPFRDQNELKMSDPIKLEYEIEKLDKKIDEFLSEVDFILSESNSRTEIEV